jgi:hypothetical protein
MELDISPAACLGVGFIVFLLIGMAALINSINRQIPVPAPTVSSETNTALGCGAAVIFVVLVIIILIMKG